MALVAVVGLTACSADEYSLHPTGITDDAPSWTVDEDIDTKSGTFTFTNTSKSIDGVKYYITTDGRNSKEFPIGATETITAKRNGTYTAMLLAVSNDDQKGIEWKKVVDWIPELKFDNQWLGFKEGTNLLESWNPTIGQWFSPADWTGGLTAPVDGDIQNGLTIKIPEGTGDGQWQAQIHIEDGGPTLSAGKTYDFSIAIEASEDMVGDGVTVKPQLQGDDNTMFSDARHPLKKGLNVISLADCAGFDGAFKIALDFAGAPIGSTVTIKKVFLTEHQNGNYTGDTWAFDYQSDNNVLKEQSFGADFRFWFADGGWGQISDPVYEGESTEDIFVITMPDGIGPDQWQGQVHMPFDNVNLSAGKNYDLSLVVVADGEVPGLTVKAQNDADDNVYLTADRHAIPAKTPTAITLTDLPGFDGMFRLCLDFGGTAAGTTVKIYGIYVGEHK